MSNSAAVPSANAPLGFSAGSPAQPALARNAAIVVCPRPDGTAALARLIQNALPSDNIVSCRSALEAIEQAELVRNLGDLVAMFALDFRGKPPGDLADAIRRIQHSHPDAEFVIFAEGPTSPSFGTCFAVSTNPAKLTFLMAPVRTQEATQTLQDISKRHEAFNNPIRALALSTSAIGRLELRIQELQARLDIAVHAGCHDALTGILNRGGFVEELGGRLARSRQLQTVLLIDLDRFKLVNDTLGHDAGDDLVRKISAAMHAVIPARGVVARLGGDEFGILLEGLSEFGVTEFADVILRVCAQNRRISGHEVQVSASIGIAQQDARATHGSLMRQADLALYAAKREGRNRFRIFDNAIEKAAKHRLSIENGLERALRSNEFSMVYQPIVDADGLTHGFEALIRWDSPEHGSIAPSDFIPVAEETGLILDIGDWIMRQALKDCRKWGGPYVSVNLSARQFLRHNVGERILQFAKDADISPRLIQVELTETAIIDDVERADNNLKILREAGVRVALDDFGTGYSSLVYLNQFAIDCIKIDKSFVDNISTDRQSSIIVNSVSRLAASLGMSVVAEGVENEDQRRVLVAAGCGFLQGYHFARPMRAQEVPAFLALRAKALPQEPQES